jgi:PAP2 superfamily
MSLRNLLLNPVIIQLGLLIACAGWVLKDEKDKSRQVLFLALLANLFYFGLFTAFMATANSVLHWKYDYYLLCVDRALGVSAAGVALAFRGAWPAVLKVIYDMMLPAMIFWLALNRKANGVVVRGYLAGFIVGPILYGLLPAAGPVYAFDKAWTHPPIVPPNLIRLHAAPINAFPSLHLATALFFVLTARCRLWRSLAVAFFAGTALSTLTTGEHYVIDLVAGMTFGCFVASVGSRRIRRAIGYLGITLAWSLAIRFGVNALIAYPGVVRLFSMLTVLVALHAVWTEWTAEGSHVAETETVRGIRILSQGRL